MRGTGRQRVVSLAKNFGDPMIVDRDTAEENCHVQTTSPNVGRAELVFHAL